VHLLQFLGRRCVRQREHRGEEEAHVVEDGRGGGVDVERVGAGREGCERRYEGRVEGEAERDL
jgi:hypothetical protein